MAFKNFLNKNKSIVGFLILEILALVSFTFANTNDVLVIIGALISMAAFVFVFITSSEKEEYYKLIPVVCLLFIISGIAAFGGLRTSFSWVSNIAVFFGLPSFFSLGFFARRLTDVKLIHVLLAIGFGFAAITLISTISTWIEYGVFYSLIYKIKGVTNYYYNGVPYDVTKEMNWFIGFKFSEVSIEYGGLFALISATFLPGLLFINRKENRNEFISILAIGGVGLISLITIPNFIALLVLVIASAFAFIYKFLFKMKKLCFSLGIVVVCIIGIGFLFYGLSILNAAVGFKFLNRIFVNNGLMKDSADVLKAAFAKNEAGQMLNILGFDLNADPTFATMNRLDTLLLTNTGIFEYQIIKEVGIIGTVLFMLFLLGLIYFVYKYIKEENDGGEVKVITVVMLLAFFAFSTFKNDILPQTHNSENYIAFLRSAPLMIMMFVMGLVYFVPSKKEKIVNE